MHLDRITPLILTFNEKENIALCLESLTWAQTVVVLDSFSSDGTTEITENFTNVKLIQRSFDTHAQQWNFGLEQLSTPWVLTLDADYRISLSVLEEIKHLDEHDCTCWSIPLRFCLQGVPLRSSILPPRPMLFKTASHSYYDDGHTQRLNNLEECIHLTHEVLHDDRKPFSRWFSNQRQYAKLEADKLFRQTYLQKPHPSLSTLLRKIPFLLPLLMPCHLLLYKGGLLDGFRGLQYASLRTFAEALISWELFKRYCVEIFNPANS